MAISKPNPAADREAQFAELWGSLNHDAIIAEITNVKTLDFDAEDAWQAVNAAAQRWLIEDVVAWNVTDVEREYRGDDFKFVVDLGGTFTGEGIKTVQHSGYAYGDIDLKRFAGLRFVADWKTTASPLDKNWQTRLEDSWQWRDYLAESGADVFVYRGIKRRTKIEDEIELREFYIHRSLQPDLAEVHTINLRGVIAQRDALIERNVVPWPQNRPSACKRFSRRCQYKDDCDSGLQFIPAGNLDKGRAMSYSRVAEFSACPELHRRSVLDKMSAVDEDESSGPDAAFGSAVHRGLASAWSQAFSLN